MTAERRLESELDRFDPSVPVGRASTPPASWYLDDAFYELEVAQVFRRSWQPVGRLDQLEAPGDYLTGSIVGEPYVVVRGETGQLHAFFNVCRHHATCVASGAGTAERLTCPYHGWVYGLDGRLLKAPRMAGVQEFDREKLGLIPMELGTWGPLVFVRLQRGGPTLEETLRPLDGRIDLEGLQFAARVRYELHCNWKVFVDNYLDGGYHVPFLHRGLAAQLELDGYRTELAGHVSLQICPDRADQEDGADLGERLGGGAVYSFLHPNFMLNRYGPILDTNWVVPLGPSRTLIVFDYFFKKDSAQEEFVARSLAASDQVQQEDISICESVQRGLASSAYDRGRYAPGVEVAAHRFHCLLAEQLRRPQVAPQ